MSLQYILHVCFDRLRSIIQKIFGTQLRESRQQAGVKYNCPEVSLATSQSKPYRLLNLTTKLVEP